MKKRRKMDSSFWYRVYRGTLLRLVFSRLVECREFAAKCRLKPIQVSNSSWSGSVGNLWFLGKSRSNPFCMVERVV